MEFRIDQGYANIVAAPSTLKMTPSKFCLNMK